MSNMAYDSVGIGADVQILKRSPFEGVAITLDFTNVNDTDTVTGLKIVKAGTPIDEDGVASNDGDAVGILLFDVLEDRPQGTILKKAYINTSVAEAHCGLTIADAVKAALPMVVFE